MSDRQMGQLRQIMAVADLKQIRYGEVIDGITSTYLRLCYVIDGVWFNETIMPNGWIHSRTIIKED